MPLLPSKLEGSPSSEFALLEGNHTVSEISYKVGFNSPSHFSTSFKRHFGESPSDYVARIRKK